MPLAIVIRNDYRYRYEIQHGPPPALAGAALAAAALGLRSELGSTADATGTPSVVHVVAAENFWGNITSQLGGRDVKVTSLDHEPQRRSPPLRDRRRRRRHAGAGAGRRRERCRLRHLDELAPRVRTAGARASSTRRTCSTSPEAIPTRTSGTTSPACPPWPPPSPPPSRRPRRGTRRRSRPTSPPSTRRWLRWTRRWPTIKAHFHNVPVAYTERVPGYALAVAGLDVEDAVRASPGPSRTAPTPARRTRWPCSACSTTTTSTCCSTTCRP